MHATPVVTVEISPSELLHSTLHFLSISSRRTLNIGLLCIFALSSFSMRPGGKFAFLGENKKVCGN